MREIRQEEAVQAYLNSDGKSIINACPRFGKIKVAIDIMRYINITHILILAPRTDIFQGWKDDLKKFNFPVIAEYCTFKSIKNLKSPAPWQLVIIDEPHELSLNQQNFLKPIVGMFPTLGLTGTMTQKTRTELYDSLNLDVCYKYGIEQGVREGILADYQLIIHKVCLDDREYSFSTKKSKYTEKGWFDLQRFLQNDTDNPLSKYMFTLKMINILQNSKAKMDKTKELIDLYKDERLLVFCGVTEVADRLNIPVYHSKNKEKSLLDSFCKGLGMHLATIKMMQAGITVYPINKGIINYMSGNPEDSAQKICRFLGFEYDNPDKKAEIHIVCSEEKFETSRLKTGLLFFEENKIKFV